MPQENSSARVTMKMVAEKAGVSVSAVSLALRNDPQIAAVTRERIQRIAREMGFSQNPIIAQLMSELRNARTLGYRRAIALLNAHPDVPRLADHVTLPFVAEGCRRRAEAGGYKCEEFWLNDPETTPRSLNALLAERRIRGVIVIGLREGRDVLTRYGTTWAAHASVAVGVPPLDLSLSYCSTGFFRLTREAALRAVDLGYRRPALVVDSRRDALLENRLTAGIWSVQARLPAADRVPPFLDCHLAGEDPTAFQAWLESAKPDVILTFRRRDVCAWLQASGRSVPEDVGLIVLDRQRNSEGWACMDQRGDLLGELAVDMLTSALNHGEIGIPKVPRSATISGVWVHGDSVIDRNRRSANGATG